MLVSCALPSCSPAFPLPILFPACERKRDCPRPPPEIYTMSLNRVASLETFLSAVHTNDGRPVRQTRERRDSASSYAASERARKLSFNPLPESWDPAFTRDDDVPNPAVGAFEVPRWKRIRTPSLPTPQGRMATRRPSTDRTRSPDLSDGWVLPLCGRHCVWLCRHQTRLEARGRLPGCVSRPCRSGPARVPQAPKAMDVPKGPPTSMA